MIVCMARNHKVINAEGSINYLESFPLQHSLVFFISGIIFPSFVFTFTIDLVSSLLLY